MVRALDIFCGVGGSSAGARAAGATIACGIDADRLATKSYRENFPEAEVLTSRLEQVRFRALKEKIGDIDLLRASPECTSHTCAKGGAPRNESSRATAMQAVRFARALRPRWVVIENVVHMRPWSRYRELHDNLRKLGYVVKEQILDSSDFGVPQARRRLFIVADLRGTPGLVKITEPKSRKTAKSILDEPGTWGTSLLHRKGRAKGTLERAQRAIKALGPGRSFLIVYYGSDGGGGWQPLDRPLRTVTTLDRFALVASSRDGLVMRMLQVDELKRAMGFDRGFSLPVGTRRDRIRLLGNAVCPQVMKAVVKALTFKIE